jgi:hypothetical protein
MKSLHRYVGVLGLGMLFFVLMAAIGGPTSGWTALGLKAAPLTEQELSSHISYFQQRLEILAATATTPATQRLLDLLAQARTGLAQDDLPGAQQPFHAFLESFYHALATGEIDRADFIVADIRASIREVRSALPAGRTWKVGPTGDFTSIGSALKAAFPGDTLLIEPGLYREDLVIDQPGLTLEGIGPSQARLRGSLTLRADAVSVQRLILSEARENAVMLEGASYVTLEELVITGSGHNGIAARGSYQYLLLEKNKIVRNGMDGVYLHGGQGSQIAVLNSEISDNGLRNARGVGLRLGGARDVVSLKNIIVNNAFAGVHPETPPPPITQKMSAIAGGAEFTLTGSQELRLLNDLGSVFVVIANLGPATLEIFVNGVKKAELNPSEQIDLPSQLNDEVIIRIKGGVGTATVNVRIR